MSEPYEVKSDDNGVEITRFIQSLLSDDDKYEGVSRDALLYEAGIFEAVKRFIKATDSVNYVDKRMLVALLGIEEDKDE